MVLIVHHAFTTNGVVYHETPFMIHKPRCPQPVIHNLLDDFRQAEQPVKLQERRPSPAGRLPAEAGHSVKSGLFDVGFGDGGHAGPLTGPMLHLSWQGFPGPTPTSWGC